jgi:hypothetical protein
LSFFFFVAAVSAAILRVNVGGPSFITFSANPIQQQQLFLYIFPELVAAAFWLWDECDQPGSQTS